MSGVFAILTFCTLGSGGASPPFALSGPVPAWSGALRFQAEHSPPPPSAPAMPSQPPTSLSTATQPPATQAQQDQPATAEQAAQPSGASQVQPAPAASEGVKLEPAQLSDLLYKVYMAAFRFTDLLSILQTDKWKMDDGARQSFNQTLETVRGQLKALDEDRKQFLEKPENSDLAEKTDADVTALLPNIDTVAAAVTQYDSPAQGTQYKQPGDKLRELQKSLRPYVLYVRAKAEAALAAPPGVQTEVVQPSAVPRAIIPTDTSGPPPMQPEQLKELLYKMYVAAFRIQDLLSQEQPEKWKTPDAERASFNQARDTLRAKLAEFEKVRSQLAASPVSADLAFQTYRAVSGLQEPLEQISRSVSTHEDAKLADEYRQRGRELTAGEQGLVPYISYFLNRWDRVTQMFQNDLAACESQLSYAMRSRTQVATPLPNVNPEFRGHGRKTTSSKQTATAKKTQSKKSAKHSSKPASTKTGQAKP